MTIKKLSAMPYAQAHVEIDDQGNTFLFSYVTLVASLDKDGWLEINGLYSMTTRRHIGAFMREYVEYANRERGNYHQAKCLYEKNLRLNIYTCELEEI